MDLGDGNQSVHNNSKDCGAEEGHVFRLQAWRCIGVSMHHLLPETPEPEDWI